MSDKQVGELWQWCQEESPQPGHDKLVDNMRDLIRNLVDERADNIQGRLPKYSTWVHKDCIESALNDFGIDPNEFVK